MNSLTLRIVVVAVSGAFGALTRWGVSHVAIAWFGLTWWPVGTLTVNVLGCFVFGAAYEWMRHTHAADSPWRALWLTGFCGAFTTFSTFAFDVVELHTTRGLAWAALNVALHLALGIGALVVGMVLGRAW